MKHLKVLVYLCALALPLAAQVSATNSGSLGTAVNIQPGPPSIPVQESYNYSGGLLTYICYARSVNPNRLTTSVAVSAASNANPVVLTSTGHGLDLKSRPFVRISGAGTGWTAINGDFTATVIDANTFSIPVNSTAFGALAGTVVFKTNAPRKGVSEHAVLEFKYDASNNLVGKFWLNGSTTFTNACSSGGGSTTQIQ